MQYNVLNLIHNIGMIFEILKPYFIYTSNFFNQINFEK